MNILQEVGQQLDRNIFPNVTNGGVVVPNTVPVSSLNLGEEKKDAKQSQRRPESQPRPRSTRRQRQANRSWQTSPAASIISPKLKILCDNELNAVNDAYPNTQVWQQKEETWLLTESSLLPDHWQKAIFLTVIPFVWPYTARSWGFWEGGLLRDPVWIGPRHTNFPDGSVCAFEPTDKTWLVGQSIVTLLDMYTLWALRHLHLQVFGRWPGRQAVFHPCERLLELKENELCGCGESNKVYGECCQENDLARDRVTDAIDFFLSTNGAYRKAPSAVVRFLREQKDPPRFISLMH